jgi:hypothetical protein
MIGQVRTSPILSMMSRVGQDRTPPLRGVHLVRCDHGAAETVPIYRRHNQPALGDSLDDLALPNGAT